MAVKSFLFSFFLLITFASVTSQSLQKVLILSRHNLRTPLTTSLSRMTPKVLPKWNEDVGFLTEKGALLENYLGKYFSEWLDKNSLITGCPKESEVHIYANTRQRTIATAKAFTESAFKNCNVKVHYKNITEMDPIFHTIVRNDSEVYISTAKQEIINKIQALNLKEIYDQLNRITDIKNSEICKEDAYCDLVKDKTGIIFQKGLEPNITGPLFIGTSMVDAFIMAYYEGKPAEEIAWGEIKTDEQWGLLTKILKENLDVRFNLTGARDFSSPLLNYIKEKILYGNEKFVLLTGHDSNLRSILRALEFNSFELPEQYELSPIGAKLVFEKWNVNNKDYLKIEYVYQSTNQLRNAEVLSLKNPPKSINMSLKNCNTDENGLCPWEDFVKIMNSVTE